jgi:hypothetical protein
MIVSQEPDESKALLRNLYGKIPSKPVLQSMNLAEICLPCWSAYFQEFRLRFVDSPFLVY